MLGLTGPWKGAEGFESRGPAKCTISESLGWTSQGVKGEERTKNCLARLTRRPKGVFHEHVVPKDSNPKIQVPCQKKKDALKDKHMGTHLVDVWREESGQIANAFWIVSDKASGKEGERDSGVVMPQRLESAHWQMRSLKLWLEGRHPQCANFKFHYDPWVYVACMKSLNPKNQDQDLQTCTWWTRIKFQGEPTRVLETNQYLFDPDTIRGAPQLIGRILTGGIDSGNARIHSGFERGGIDGDQPEILDAVFVEMKETVMHRGDDNFEQMGIGFVWVNTSSGTFDCHNRAGVFAKCRSDRRLRERSRRLKLMGQQHRIPGYELTKLPRLILCPLWPDEDPYHLLARHIASQAGVFDAGFEPIVHRLQAHRSEYFEVSTSLTALIYNIYQRIWNCRSLPKGSTGNLVVTIVTGKEQGGGVDLVSEAIQAWIAQEVVMSRIYGLKADFQVGSKSEAQSAWRSEASCSRKANIIPGNGYVLESRLNMAQGFLANLRGGTP
ncbi:hypothetical protein BKA70DRAFT_1239508 [Coprinopsis sp. MPI-PUGE-AT-0042]|nr:hypothetical protein BKA70DRAFT_1239508 [Coprinopsis sp. MPI-PUGE-AT-0042]